MRSRRITKSRGTIEVPQSRKRARDESVWFLLERNYRLSFARYFASRFADDLAANARAGKSNSNRRERDTCDVILRWIPTSRRINRYEGACSWHVITGNEGYKGLWNVEENWNISCVNRSARGIPRKNLRVSLQLRNTLHFAKNLLRYFIKFLFFFYFFLSVSD